MGWGIRGLAVLENVEKNNSEIRYLSSFHILIVGVVTPSSLPMDPPRTLAEVVYSFVSSVFLEVSSPLP